MSAVFQTNSIKVSVAGLCHNPYNFNKSYRADTTHYDGGVRNATQLKYVGAVSRGCSAAEYPPEFLLQLMVGQCGYDANEEMVRGVLELYAADTVVLSVEQHKKGPKPTGAFFVTVLAGTEGPLVALHQRIRFLHDGVMSFKSNDLATYDKEEVKRILCWRQKKGEIRDHLPVYRMTVEYKGVKGSPLPDFEKSPLGQEINHELNPPTASKSAPVSSGPNVCSG